MESSIYLQIAEEGLSMPLGVDMVLHDAATELDIERALSNGEELGQVVVRAARRFGVPLAVPHMDLTLEKELLLQGLGLGRAPPPPFTSRAHPRLARCRP